MLESSLSQQYWLEKIIELSYVLKGLVLVTLGSHKNNTVRNAIEVG